MIAFLNWNDNVQSYKGYKDHQLSVDGLKHKVNILVYKLLKVMWAIGARKFNNVMGITIMILL